MTLFIFTISYVCFSTVFTISPTFTLSSFVVPSSCRTETTIVLTTPLDEPSFFKPSFYT